MKETLHDISNTIKIQNAISENEDCFIDGIVNAESAETIQRYGAAVKEHVVAYTGIDNETGKHLKKGLKSISQSKINPQYANQNIQQQAGFSAEVKAAARENAERIIRGDKNRTNRTDDTGQVNDPFYDLQVTDSTGTIIPGTGVQMKFVGQSPKDCLNKLTSSKYKKYRDAGIPFEVPSDFYDEVSQELDVKIAKLEEQKQAAQKLGKSDVVQKIQARINDIKQIKVKKSTVSKDEAIEARTDPKLSTAKDIHHISHEAAKQAARSGFLIGGTVSGIQNMICVFKGEKHPIEIAKEASWTATKSAVRSYVRTYGTTTLIGFMKNSNKQFIRTLSKTGIPGTFISIAEDSLNAIWQWMHGEITGTQCITQMGKNGASIIMSTSYAAAGQVLIPIPVVGGLIGSMVGYSLVSSYYSELVKALKEAEIAHEERLRIEAECEEAIKAIREYRTEINRIMDEYLKEYQSTFDTAFENIKTALQTEDADNFISSVNIITRKLNGTPEFDTVDEFDIRMTDPTIIKL